MKLYPYFSKTEKCDLLQEKIVSARGDLLVDTPEAADMIVVGGGDGWTLDAMRTYFEADKPFFGINCGTEGFLTNKECELCLDKLSEDQLEYITTQSIDVTLTSSDGKEISGFARNDIVIGAHVLDYSHFQIQTESETIQTSGTGLVISTALGSTAYAANLGVPIIPLDSTLRSISGIATGEWKYSFVQPHEISIQIESRSPLSVGLDGYNQVHKDIGRITLRPGTHQATLAFLTSENFAERRLILAEKKLGN